MHAPPLCFVALFLIVPAAAQTIFDATKEGNTQKVRELLVSDPALVHLKDSNLRTPLHHAADRGHIDIVTVLLDAGADINALEEDDETPLHHAAWRSRLAAGKLLIDKGADLERKNRWGRTPLLVVCRETGNADMARLLIGSGADVNARDRSNVSSLALAAWRGFMELVDVLLDSGAELPPAESQAAKLMAKSAAEKGLLRLFDRCEEAGVDLSLHTESQGSLLHSAAQGGSADIVARLLDAGFDPNERDLYGRTPIHYAAELGRKEVARVLTDRGADINARSHSGETAYNTAQWVRRPEMAAFLASAGAETDPPRFPELKGPFMGQHPPGPEAMPKLFAVDIVSTPRFQHGTVAFSPAGDEAIWSSQIAIQETGYSEGVLLFSHVENGAWTPPAPVPFSRVGIGDDVPIFAPDGQRLYFLSRRVASGEEGNQGERVWYAERTSEGWSEPSLIEGGPNLKQLHWGISVSANGSVYVGSRGDLFVSRYVNGRYEDPASVGALVNSEADESMPFIAPDGSYLLFCRIRHPENIDFADLWISFADENGEWMTPLNLGKGVNELAGICPIVSPDGKFLFFNSGNDDNYWVDAAIIGKLRAQHKARASERK